MNKLVVNHHGLIEIYFEFISDYIISMRIYTVLPDCLFQYRYIDKCSTAQHDYRIPSIALITVQTQKKKYLIVCQRL